jgi:hypothetical protein
VSRSHGRIYARIWDDADFVALAPGAQRMYLFLLSQPDLSQAGLLPLRVRRWARSSAGLTPAAVREDLEALERARFVVVDEDAEELLIRTFVRNDQVYRQPKVMVRMAEDARQMASPRLREVFCAELARLPLRDLSGTQQDVAVDVVGALLREFGWKGIQGEEPQVSTDPDTLPDTHRDTPGEGFGEPSSRARTRVHQPPTTNQTPSLDRSAAEDTSDALFGADPDPDTRASPPGFDTFWAAYPRKVGKADARKAWDAAVRGHRGLAAAITDGARRFAADPNLPEPQYVPHPGRWLRREGWTDEPCPPRPGITRPPDPRDRVLVEARRNGAVLRDADPGRPTCPRHPEFPADACPECEDAP